jgi:uncharacterized UPF0160 family protein
MEKMNVEEQVVPKENRIEKIITHEGPFHTDEVFGTALLKDIFPESMELKSGGKTDFVKYLRTRDKKIVERARDSESTMLIDEGADYDYERFIFDHHQLEGAGERENGVKYATAGLIWKHFGKEWIKYVDVYSRHADLSTDDIELISHLVDENYVQYIDANDTGQMESITCTLSDGTQLDGKAFSLAEIVRLYNVDTRDKTAQQRFDAAVEVMRTALFSIVSKYMELIEGLRKLKLEKCEFLADNRAVIINQNIGPTVTSYAIDKKEEFKDVEYFAVLNPKGGYSIMVAPTREGIREYRNPNMIPKELRLGNNVEEMNTILGVEKGGMLFSHPVGFFAQCKDLETAKKFLTYCTNKEK